MQKLTNFNIEKTTAEILMLKDQTAQNIIEIGKRLIEVKENLEHGEFINWLENKVDFSRYTANRFMKIATEFSNVAAIQHLNSTKLFLLAGLDDEDRQELMQEKNIEDMTTRELEQVVKEKKEIKKQLEAEQEYSNELQEAIKQKDKQIQELKQLQKEPKIIEKEVVKEVVPETINNQIVQLEKEKEQLIKEKEKIQEERNQYYEKAKKVESDLKEVKLTLKSEQTDGYRYQDVSEIGKDISYFLGKCSKYTYFKEEYSKLSWQHRKIVEDAVNKVDVWVKKMRQALLGERDISKDLIYGEGEVIDE